MSVSSNDYAPSRHRVLVLSLALAAVIGVGVGGAYLVGIAQRNLKSPQTTPVVEQSVGTGAISADPAGDGTPATGPTDAELVQVSQTASGSALAGPIDEVLTRYFQAINDGDYAAYSATVTSPLAESDFGSIYVSTLDSDGLIHNIYTDGAGLTQITLSFISRQSVELAPADLPSACIAWTVFWGIDGQSDALTIGASDPTRTQKVPCISQ